MIFSLLLILGILIIVALILLSLNGATLISNGWLEISDGSDTMLLYFKSCFVDWEFESTIRHYAGGGHLAYHMGKQYLVWIVKDIRFDNHSDFDLFMGTINSWMAAGTFTLKVKRASASYIVFDGTNTSYTVMIPKGGLKGAGKESPGDQDNGYIIKMLRFEQCG